MAPFLSATRHVLDATEIVFRFKEEQSGAGTRLTGPLPYRI